MEKQLVSWLKAAESDIGPVESSMTCLVFMMESATARGHDRADMKE